MYGGYKQRITMMSKPYETYDDYLSAQHQQEYSKNPRYILQIRDNELTYENFCVAVKKAAGDCNFIQSVFQKYPHFIDENLCEIAVSGTPESKVVRKETGYIDMPEGDEEYEFDIVQYKDPVLKYIPEEFRTERVCRAAIKYDWRSLEFVPAPVQSKFPDILEYALNNCDNMMPKDVEYYNTGKMRQTVAVNWVDKAVFIQNPYIFDGKYTLQHVASEWILANTDTVVALLSKYPKQICFLPAQIRKKSLDNIIRPVVTKNPEIICYLSEKEQESVSDLIETKLEKHGSIFLGSLCQKLQEKYWDLISKLVCEDIDLLEKVKKKVLISHPKIYEDIIDKYGVSMFDEIPKSVFNKYPYLYDKLLQKSPTILPKLPKRYQTQTRWHAAIEKDPWLIKVAPVKFMTEQDYKDAVLNLGLSLSSVPEKFRTYDVCKIALDKSCIFIEYVPEKIKIQHPDLCKPVVEKHPNMIKYVPEIVQLQHYEICEIAVKGNPNVLENVPASVQRKYPEICRLAIAQVEANCGCFPFWGRGKKITDIINAEKTKLYGFIPPDVLRLHWDYINGEPKSADTTVPFQGGRQR